MVDFTGKLHWECRGIKKRKEKLRGVVALLYELFHSDFFNFMGENEMITALLCRPNIYWPGAVVMLDE